MAAKAFLLRHRDLLTAGLLGLESGYVTSNTNIRYGTFGGMMTGNTVKLGMAMSAGDWPAVGVYVCVLSCFALGTLCCLIMLRSKSAFTQRLWLFAFSASIVLVDVINLAVRSDEHVYDRAVSALAAFALGAQNCLSQKSAVVKANTTFMTGNIQKMAEAVFLHFTKGLKPSERRAALLLLVTWLTYVLGGLVGYRIASCPGTFCQEWSLAPAAVLYGVGMLSMHYEEPKPNAPPPPKPSLPLPAPQASGQQPTEAASSAAAVAAAPAAAAAAAPDPAATAATEAAKVVVEVHSPATLGRKTVLTRQNSVEGDHATSPVDGRRALGEDAQM